MAQRRPRASLGLANVSGSSIIRIDGSINEEDFKDFRRRHSRQNKDIILENVNRKAIIKSLQEEIASLHIELLEVRHANVLLHAKMKRMDDSSSLGGRATRDALDHVFAAIPALQHLWETLTAASPFTEPSERCGSSRTVRNASNVVATRPAAAWADAIGLGTVSEATEWGSEDGDERKSRRRSRGRRSGVGSIAASRSPLPLKSRDSNPRHPSSKQSTLEASSPQSSASPSPQKRTTVPRSPHTGKKHKRRRESGLLPPQQRGQTPETSEQEGGLWQVEVPSLQEVYSDVGDSQNTRGKSRPGGSVRVRDIAAQLGSVKRAMGVTKEDQAEGLPRPASPEGLSPVEEERASEGISSGPSLSSRAESALFSPEPSSAEGTDDDGFRGRRVRKSVNYKEPSLTKKMRKPDGLATNDAIRRPSLSALLSPGEMLQPHMPQPQPDFSGMRRKSVLPKHGVPSEQPVDDNDEDDVDDLPDLLPDREVPQVDDVEAEEVNNHTAFGRGEPSPTPLPRDVSLSAVCTKGDEVYVLPPVRATKPKATRTSPRKNGVKIHPPPVRKDTLSVGFSRMLPNTSRSVSAGQASSGASLLQARGALVDLPSDNGQAGPPRRKATSLVVWGP